MIDYKRQLKRNLELSDIVWDILTQWKALLLVAVIMAILVAGLKYSSDIKIYNTAVSAEKEKEIEVSTDSEQQIEDILEGLPQSDRILVMQAIKQNQWINGKNSYIEDSLFMKMNPYDIRTLILGYYIGGITEPSVISALAAGYSTPFDDEELNLLADVISPGASPNTIEELISFDDKDDNENGAYVQLSIYLPDEVDADSVREAVNGLFSKKNKQLASSVADHTISLYYSEDTRCVDKTASEKQIAVISNGYSVQNWQKGMSDSFTEQQKSAYTRISSLLAAQNAADDAAEPVEEIEETETIAKPVLSKKYLILGLIIGILIYTAGYGLILLITNRINSASDARYYGGARLLGELYLSEENRGIKGLFYSKLVNRLRYGEKLNTEKQKEKMFSASKAVLAHKNADSFTLVDLNNDEGSIYNDIAGHFGDEGVSADLIRLEKDFDENKLLGIRNMIMVAGRNTDAAKLTQFVELCNSYDITHLGTVFVKTV